MAIFIAFLRGGGHDGDQDHASIGGGSDNYSGGSGGNGIAVLAYDAGNSFNDLCHFYF